MHQHEVTSHSLLLLMDTRNSFTIKITIPLPCTNKQQIPSLSFLVFFRNSLSNLCVHFPRVGLLGEHDDQLHHDGVITNSLMSINNPLVMASATNIRRKQQDITI